MIQGDVIPLSTHRERIISIASASIRIGRRPRVPRYWRVCGSQSCQTIRQMKSPFSELGVIGPERAAMSLPTRRAYSKCEMNPEVRRRTPPGHAEPCCRAE